MSERDKRWEGLEEDLDALSQGVTTDWYRGVCVVSIERAAGRELELKREIDDARDAENLYSSNSGQVGNGDAPCRVANKLHTG